MTIRRARGRRPNRRRGAIALALLAPALLSLVGCNKYGSSIARPEDPVVLTAASTPKLLGTVPASVVGFAWNGTGWFQIPTQVDERDMVNPGQILHRATANYAKNADGTAFKVLAYTDLATASAGYKGWPTYTGTDSVPTVDANDEISFLATDTGKQIAVDTPAPADTLASSREEVKVTDPLTSAVGFAYLFTSTSPTLTGGSGGTTKVNYQLILNASPTADYKGTYKMGTAALAPNNSAGFNSEASNIETPSYTQQYSDRWLNSVISIAAGGASKHRILERGRYQFAPGVCGRSEDTFDGGDTNPYEGGFLTNLSGPVRAIRSYIGANSGQYTINTDIFYPQRQDSITDLRVHAIPGVMAFDDMFDTGAELTYSDDQNTGIPIDGVPDSIVAAHSPVWQMVSSPTEGSLVTARTVDTDIAGLQLSTYYLDQSSASPRPCTGDADAWGQNGVAIVGAGGGQVPCTDPTRAECPTGTVKRLSATRFRYFEGPSLSSASAAGLAARALAPLVTTVNG